MGALVGYNKETISDSWRHIFIIRKKLSCLFYSSISQ